MKRVGVRVRVRMRQKIETKIHVYYISTVATISNTMAFRKYMHNSYPVLLSLIVFHLWNGYDNFYYYGYMNRPHIFTDFVQLLQLFFRCIFFSFSVCDCGGFLSSISVLCNFSCETHRFRCVFAPRCKCSKYYLLTLISQSLTVTSSH